MSFLSTLVDFEIKGYDFVYDVSNIDVSVILLEALSPEASRGVLQRKMLLKILQNSQENACVKSLFFNKVAGL